MFLWHREPKIVAKERAIPIPLQSGTSQNNFKNSSTPQSSTPSDGVVPEFSRIATSESVESLRKLVEQHSPQLTSKSNIKPTSDTMSPEVDQLNNHAECKPSVITETASTASTWIWSRISSNSSTETSLPPATGAADHHSSFEPVLSQAETTAKHSVSESDQINKKLREKPSFRFFRYENPKEPADTKELSPISTKRPVAEICATDRSTISSFPDSSSSYPNAVPMSLVLPKYETITGRSRLARLLWSEPSSKMVRVAAQKPKKAVIIGIHGYFPARVTRRFLGEPTGTSEKFANEAEQQLRKWMASQGEPEDRVEIDKILLEGEGKIGLRIDVLYELLMKWRDLVVQADFLLFAAHSQGAVVTTGIVDRLIKESVLHVDRQNISILAMAGSWLGPMPGLDQMLIMKAITRIENDSLSELFELQATKLPLSQQLQASLNRVLKNGIKVVLVGSVDDQLIPLYSALALNIKHPNLFRAIYIDGQDVVPLVISPLLELATRQLNAGYSDHGVIVEISTALAGALTSKGHSKLYSNDKVYDIALRVALETQATQGVDAEFTNEFMIPRATTANPYRLPWSVQSIVNDCKVKKELQGVIMELLQQFKEWGPETKAMKDLKWRLVGLGYSKL